MNAAEGLDFAQTEVARASLDHCVKCTICETHCPVSAVTPKFTGPKFVGPQAERFRHGEPSSTRAGALARTTRAN